MVCDLITYNKFSFGTQRQSQKCVGTFAGYYCYSMEFFLVAGTKQGTSDSLRLNIRKFNF